MNSWAQGGCVRGLYDDGDVDNCCGYPWMGLSQVQYARQEVTRHHVNIHAQCLVVIPQSVHLLLYNIPTQATRVNVLNYSEASSN